MPNNAAKVQFTYVSRSTYDGLVTNSNTLYSVEEANGDLTLYLGDVQIGAKTLHTHDYLPLSGGTVTGETRFSNAITYFGGTGANTAEIWMQTGNAGSPQIGFTDNQGDMSWAVGGDDNDNSFKIHGVAGGAIPVINGLETPFFEIDTSGNIYNSGNKMATEAFVTSQGYITSYINNYLTGLSFNTGNGIITATRNGLNDLTVDLDGRYLEATAKAADSELLDGINSTGFIKHNEVIMGTNPFGGRKLYINSIDNALYAADKRFNVIATRHLKTYNSESYPKLNPDYAASYLVTGTGANRQVSGNPNIPAYIVVYEDTTLKLEGTHYTYNSTTGDLTFTYTPTGTITVYPGPEITQYLDSPGTVISASAAFDGNYETGVSTSSSDYYVKIRIERSDDLRTKFDGYPYGDFYLSYYYGGTPESAEYRVYNYSYYAHGVGWKKYDFTDYTNTNQSTAHIQKYSDEGNYGRTVMEFIIYGKVPHIGSYQTSLTQIDWKLSRPNLSRDGSTVTKYGINKLYYNLNFGNQTSNLATIAADGTITGQLINADSLDVNGRVGISNDGIITWGSSKQQGIMSWDTGKVIIGGQANNAIDIRTNSSLALHIDTTKKAIFYGDVGLEFAGAKLRVGPRYTSGGDRDYIDILSGGTDSVIQTSNDGTFAFKNLDLNGDMSFWTNATKRFTITPTGELEYYSGETTNRFSIGRSSTQRFEMYVTDMAGYINYQQDEASGDHDVYFNIVTPTSGQKRFIFNKDLYEGANRVYSAGNKPSWTDILSKPADGTVSEVTTGTETGQRIWSPSILKQAIESLSINSYTETDPVFTAWDKSTGISITKSQVSDFAHDHTILKENSLIDYGTPGLQWTDQSGTGGLGGDGEAPTNPYSDWFHHLIMNHANVGGYYTDIITAFHQDKIFFRRVANGVKSDIFEIYHEGHKPQFSEVEGSVAHTQLPYATATQRGAVRIELVGDTLKIYTE